MIIEAAPISSIDLIDHILLLFITAIGAIDSGELSQHRDSWVYHGFAGLLLLYIRISVFLVIAVLAVKFLKFEDASRKHLLVTLAFFACLLAPHLSHLLPPLHFTVYVDSHHLDSSGGIFSAKEQIIGEIISSADMRLNDLEPISNVIFSFLSIYFAVAIFLLVKVLVSCVKVYCVSAHAQPLPSDSSWMRCLVALLDDDKKCHRNIVIKHSPLVSSPMTFGFFNPVILVPSMSIQWSEQLISSVLRHEYAHVKRADWFTQQVVRCICAIYWMNPIVWRMYGAMRGYAELASDDFALRTGKKKSEYADDLLKVAHQSIRFRRFNLAAIMMSGTMKQSELNFRMNAILDPSASHRAIESRQKVSYMLAIFAACLPIVSLNANIQEEIIQTKSPVHPLVVLPEDPLTSGPDDGQAIDLVELKKIALFGIDAERLQTEANLRGASLAVENSEADSEPENVKTTVSRKRSVTDAIAAKAKEIVEHVGEKRQMLSARRDDAHTDGLASKTPVSTTKNLISVEEASPEKQLTPSPINQKPSVSRSSTMLANDDIAKGQAVKVEDIAKDLVTPRYPAHAERRGIEGQVIVQYGLDKNGKITDMDIVYAKPKKVFNRAVLKALKRSTFTPKKINGVPVPAHNLRETYVFVLEEGRGAG